MNCKLAGYGITGGLKKYKKSEFIKIGSLEFAVNDRFRNAIKDALINWGTFLEVYGKSITQENLYLAAEKLLGLKSIEKIGDLTMPVIEKEYNLPDEEVITKIMKHDLIYEPLSMSIHNIFMLFKRHFESIVCLYAESYNLFARDQKINWAAYQERWDLLNSEHHLESSSVILLFLNPTTPELVQPENMLPFTIESDNAELQESMERLRNAIKQFQYKGFCPKVPYERFAALMEFPIKQFTDTISILNPKNNIVNVKYELMERKMQKILSRMPKMPDIKDPIFLKRIKYVKYKQRNPPKDFDNIELMKWYVSQILERRKSLVPIGHAMEKYYTQLAQVINEAYLLAKKYLEPVE